MMNRLAALLSLTLITAVPAVADSAIVQVNAGLLTDSSGNPISNGDLILLLVSQSGVFGPTVGNSFVSGDDLIVSSGSSSTGSVTGAFGMSTALTNTPGETDNSIGFDFGEGATRASASSIVTNTAITTGDKLAIRWYSNFTLAQFKAGGTPTGNYGTYTTTALLPNDDGGADWVVPSSTSAVELEFFTSSDPGGGDQSPALGEALTPTGNGIVVPEPSTYALLVTGLLFAAGVAVRRNRLVGGK